MERKKNSQWLFLANRPACRAGRPFGKSKHEIQRDLLKYGNQRVKLLVDEHQNSNNTPFKFNGKEFDEETGNYYYGARYYNPKWSIWLNVDPLAGYNPILEVEHYIDGQHNGGVFNAMNLNSYGYTYQNPIRYIDPNGKQVDFNAIPQLNSLGSYIENEIKSYMNSFNEELKNIGNLLLNLDYNPSGGFNFTSSEAGNGNSKNKGGRDTESANADGFIQAGRQAKPAYGPKMKSDKPIDLLEEILTVTSNANQGFEIGGDIQEKMIEVTAKFATEVEQTGKTMKMVNVKDSTVVVENEQQAQEFIQKAKQSIENKLNSQ